MKNKGFTLAELAIVMTIGALLIVAVVRGMAIIDSAKAKDVVSVVADFKKAIAQFQQRYKYLPGDWPYTANEIPWVTAATANGTNGNGLVEGTIAADGMAQADSEIAALPFHLYGAGFIERINSSNPQAGIVSNTGIVHVVSGARADTLVAGFAVANPTARNAIVFYRLSCAAAQEADVKLDDGSLTTGKAMGTACANDVVLWYAVAL